MSDRRGRVHRPGTTRRHVTPGGPRRRSMRPLLRHRVSSVRVARQHHIEPASKGAAGRGGHTHLRQESADGQPAHVCATQDGLEVGPREAVVLRLAHDAFPRYDAHQVPSVGSVRVRRARSAVVLQVHDEATRGASLLQLTVHRCHQWPSVRHRVFADDKGALHVHHQQGMCVGIPTHLVQTAEGADTPVTLRAASGARPPPRRGAPSDSGSPTRAFRLCTQRGRRHRLLGS